MILDECCFDVTQPDPDAALHRLILKRDHLLDDGAQVKATTLTWELLHRPAQTREGHAAKLRMIAGIEFETCDLPKVIWILGVESGRLGIGGSMPMLRVKKPSRMAATA
jgi:hypothetical protein